MKRLSILSVMLLLLCLTFCQSEAQCPLTVKDLQEIYSLKAGPLLDYLNKKGYSQTRESRDKGSMEFKCSVGANERKDYLTKFSTFIITLLTYSTSDETTSLNFKADLKKSGFDYVRTDEIKLAGQKAPRLVYANDRDSLCLYTRQIAGTSTNMYDHVMWRANK